MGLPLGVRTNALPDKCPRAKTPRTGARRTDAPYRTSALPDKRPLTSALRTGRTKAGEHLSGSGGGALSYLYSSNLLTIHPHKHDNLESLEYARTGSVSCSSQSTEPPHKDQFTPSKQWLKCNGTQGNAVPPPPIYGLKRSPPQIVIMLGKGTRLLSGAQTWM